MMFNRLALLALLAAGAGLSAQDTRFGIHANLNFPQSDLKDAVDNKMGYGLGVHVAVDLGQGHLLRPRFDYTQFPKWTESGIGWSESTQFRKMALGVDYLYYVSGKASEGLYLTAGLAANRWNVKWEENVAGLGSSSLNENTTKLGLTAGLGYQFNKTFGTELTYESGKAWEGNANTIKAGVTFRF